MPRTSFRSRRPLFVSFLAGISTAVLVVSLTASVPRASTERYEDLSLFTHVLSLVRGSYVEPVDEHALLRGAVRGLGHRGGFATGGSGWAAVVPRLRRHTGRAGRSRPLDPSVAELEPHVCGVSFDQPSEGLRSRVPGIPDDVVGDRCVM